MPAHRIGGRVIQFGLIALTSLTLFLGCLLLVHVNARSAPLAASITQISPSSAVAGGAGFTLTISASDFDTSTVSVLWAGSPLPDANVVDTATIIVSVPADYIATAGYITLVLTDALSYGSAPVTFIIDNPVPVITAVDPLTFPAGTGLAVTITGTDFVSDTQVDLGSALLSVTHQTSTTLAAMASAGTFTQSGSYTLTVANPAPGGGSTTIQLIVTAAALSTLHIDPSTATMAVSTTQVFTASCEDVFGNAISPLAVTWSLSPALHGSIVSMGPLTVEFLAGTLPGTFGAGLIASAEGISRTADVTITAGPVAQILLSPSAATLPAGMVQLFTASGVDELGNQITPLAVTWSVPSSAAAAILSSGPLTALAQLTTTAGVYARMIQASSQNLTRTADITVTPGTLARLDLTPESATLAVSTTAVFTASGHDIYGNTITPLSLAWSVSPTLAGSVISTGPVTAILQARTTSGAFPDALSASAMGVSATLDLTVTPGGLSTIGLTPAAASMAVSTTSPFTATGYDLYGNPISALSMAWDVSPNMAGAIVSSGPSTATFRSGTVIGEFLAALRASALGITGNADITVTAGALARINLTPNPASMMVNSPQPFSASGFDAYNNPVTPLAVTWSVSPSIAGSVLSSGPVTASFRAGTVAGMYLGALRASAMGVTTSASITVLPGALSAIIMTPGAATLVVGTTRVFTATGFDAFGNITTPLTVSWKVMAVGAGGIGAQNAVTAIFTAGTSAGPYSGAIQVTASGITGTADVLLIPAALVTLRLAPNATTLPVNTPQTFTALGHDIYGNLITTLNPIWSVANTAGTIVPSGGLAADFRSGTVPGTYRSALQASGGGITASADISIAPGPPFRVSIDPRVVSLPISSVQVFNATVVDTYGNVIPGPPLAWSAVISAGTITSTGSSLATFTSGASTGTYFDAVRASAGNVTGTSDVIVHTGSVAYVDISPSVVTAPVNSMLLFTATVLDAAHNVINDLSVTWLQPACGTIQSTGSVTMLFQVGTTAGFCHRGVKAAQGSVIGQADVIVTPGSLASLQLTPSAASVQVSTTQVFTALGSDLYGNSIPSFNIAWSVSPGTAGSVQASGGITAVFRAGTLAQFFRGAIRGTSGTISDTSDLTVTPNALARIALTPSMIQLPVNATNVLTASGFDNYGNSIPAISVAWSVSPSQAGSIASSNVVTAVFQAGTRAGPYPNAVWAKSGIVSASANITVTSGPLARIALTPGAVSLAISATQVFTAAGADSYGNPIAPPAVAWSADNTAGSIVLSNGTTAMFRAGKGAGTHYRALQAAQGGVAGTADVVIRPDLPARMTMRASPDVIRTDGISASTIVISVADRYGNSVGPGAWVTASATGMGLSRLTPPIGTTGVDGSFNTVLTSALRAVTQTVISTIRVTALVSSAVAPGGYITNAMVVTGIFVPFKIFVPVLALNYPLNNHAACTALAMTPPVSVVQGADQFNLYRFVAGSPSYDFSLTSYPASGGLYLYQIVADNCAISSTIALKTITFTNVITGQSLLPWSVNNVFTPGLSYMLLVYNATHVTAATYRLTIVPRTLLELRQASNPFNSTGMLPDEPFTMDSRTSPFELLQRHPHGPTRSPQLR